MTQRKKRGSCRIELDEEGQAVTDVDRAGERERQRSFNSSRVPWRRREREGGRQFVCI